MAFRAGSDNFTTDTEETKLENIHSNILTLNKKLQEWKKEHGRMNCEYEELMNRYEQLKSENTRIEENTQNQVFLLEELEGQLTKKQDYLSTVRQCVEGLKQVLEQKKQEQISIRDDYQKKMQEISEKLAEASSAHSRKKLLEEINILKEKEKRLDPELKARETELKELKERCNVMFAEAEQSTVNHTGVFGLKILISQLEAQIEKTSIENKKIEEESINLSRTCKQLEETLDLCNED